MPKSPYRNAKLLIKPSKKNVSAFYRKVREIIKGSGALTQDALIGQLNPVLKGWAQYHSPVVAKEAFSKLDNLIFWRIWRWAKRRHPRKSADWIRNKYFRSIGRQNWVFAYPYKNGKGERQHRRLYGLAETAIVRHKRLPGVSALRRDAGTEVGGAEGSTDAAQAALSGTGAQHLPQTDGALRPVRACDQQGNRLARPPRHQACGRRAGYFEEPRAASSQLPCAGA